MIRSAPITGGNDELAARHRTDRSPDFFDNAAVLVTERRQLRGGLGAPMRGSGQLQ
jgi:hypothetical protein